MGILTLFEYRYEKIALSIKMKTMLGNLQLAAQSTKYMKNL